MRNDSLWFVPYEKGVVSLQGEADTTLVYVDKSVRIEMQTGDLHWFIIKRGTEYGMRLKDYNYPLLSTFNHIDTYPIDAKWKVKAKWTAYDEPRTVTVHNQVGMELQRPVPGILNFELEGKKYALEPTGSTKYKFLFVMLYDATSGNETYGSGRYLEVPQPNAAGETYIDFNKAYNPPCAFTEFATCLFPHKENRLPIKIEAGEKYTGSH
jgi:uncharacterized protein (DUF1684 family)